MTDRQETIADIIAWLRKPREGENAYLTLWRDEIADRLEAAWKRERELTKPAEIVNSGEASDTAGNCAKLREALVKCPAKLSESRQAELERVKRENANFAVECERLAKENNNLRYELSTRPTTRKLQPVTKTAICNANDVLFAFCRVITSEENLQNKTVPADQFHTVYKTLRDLVSRLEQEGLA